MRALLAAATLLAAAGLALAHVPVEGGGPGRIAEPGRSWAFFEELPAGGTHRWTFDLAPGDPLHVTVAVPTGAAWTPTARLAGPAGEVALEEVGETTLEPFTPFASRTVLRAQDPAPAAGAYALTIEGSGGPYLLGFGLREEFTPGEWLSIPIEAQRIHRWEGQGFALLLAPYLAGLVAGLALPAARATGPRFLGALAAGLLVGTALERALQLAIAWGAGARDPAGFLLAAALAVPALVLAAVAARARSPYVLAGAGALALATWSGLWLGPGLLAAQAAFAAGARRRARAGPAGGFL